MSPYNYYRRSKLGRLFDLSQVIFRTDRSSSNVAKVCSSVDLDKERRTRKKKLSSTSSETDTTLKCITLVQDRPQLWQKEHCEFLEEIFQNSIRKQLELNARTFTGFYLLTLTFPSQQIFQNSKRKYEYIK